MNPWLRTTLPTMLLVVAPAFAQAPDADSDMIPDAYAAPGELVRLPDGRALNLRCDGTGDTVVMFESGTNADSTAWYRVIPRLARVTRVCAYDRAGYGFSDEGPQPRDLDANVADLHALLEAAGIRLPVLLVGHSRGSNIVRKYAQAYPGQVAGMVLVDPTEQVPDDRMPETWRAQNAAALAQRDVFLDDCAQAAATENVEAFERCLRAPPPWMGERVASAMKRNKSLPSYWRTLRSELADNIGVFSTPVPADESYGSIPLVLLRAAEQEDDVPADIREVTEAARSQTHARILAASTQSIEVEVPDTSHDIQLDQPDAVVSAVQRLLGTDESTNN
jgi:pimeloyl-ACP methyl ester carboxylesterase